MSTKDFDTNHLKGEGKKIAETITAFIRDCWGEEPDGGGCRAFYTPKEWKERGEEYATESKLVLCHDGGVLYDIIGGYSELYKTQELLADLLQKKHGVFIEACTGWYSAVYKI